MMMRVVGSVLLAVVATATGPLSGAYSEKGPAGAWICQLTLDADARMATFEFILNNGCGRANLENPKYFKMENLPYTFNEVESTLTFLHNGEEKRKEVADMIEFFKPLGNFPVPVETRVSEDGDIFAKILLVSARMKLSEAPLDMQAMFNEIKARRGNDFNRPQVGVPKVKAGSPPPAIKVASEVNLQTAETTPTTTTKGVMVSSVFWLLLLTVMLAPGAMDWLQLV